MVRHFAALKQFDAVSRRAQQAAGVLKVKSLSLADVTRLAYGLQAGLPVLIGDRRWTTLSSHGLAVDVYEFRDGSLTV